MKELVKQNPIQGEPPIVIELEECEETCPYCGNKLYMMTSGTEIMPMGNIADMPMYYCETCEKELTLGEVSGPIPECPF